MKHILIAFVGLILVYIGELDMKCDIILLNGTNPYKQLLDILIVCIGVLIVITEIIVVNRHGFK